MPQIKVLCIGDSHTAGFPGFDPLFGGNPESSYEYWLEIILQQKYNKIRFFFDNKGLCGQTSSEILGRYSLIMEKEHYDFVIFWAGANDLAFNYSTKEILQNISKSIDIANKSNTPMIIVNIPPMGWTQLSNAIQSLNTSITSLQKSNVVIADVNTKLGRDNKLFQSFDSGDGIHLSPDGYKEVAKVLFASINHIMLGTNGE